MGKRNRVKLNKRKGLISNFALMSRLIPGPRDIIESKERFIDQLKFLYSKYLKELQNAIQLRKRNLTPRLLKLNANIEEFNYYEYYNHDQCDEFNHIFSIQVNRFINSVLLYLREIFLNHTSIMKFCVQDSKIILEIACKEAQKITFFLYQSSENSYQDISNILFQERIVKDKILSKFFQENTSFEKADVGAKAKEELGNAKKKKKKRKKIESVEDFQELDKEVEEFKCKLEMESLTYKIKPNLSDEWISGLRKRLKKAYKH